MASQQQSPLFRLLRELRHEIYGYYLFEKDGYLYDYDLGELWADGRNPHIDLMYTCKAIANEFKGLPFRTNKLTFTTGYYERNQGEFDHI
ncbi:hypothetical protein BCR34DRAFT_569221 [Clohesyomyces aquaticus]|uniref:Uncharacterized protein n=1 Tax=Clohesyomyces aquaticus TaxID=1231657 RepID=A0A1Y1ZFA7_9PLEO|nr:hypothetical protein BCR34DRAFT_569221 [Clohesyomyces aquaticus]